MIETGEESMKFTIANPELLQRGLESINQAAAVAEEQSTSNPQIRLRAFGQHVELLAHDDVVQAATLLPANVSFEGSCKVSVRLLLCALEVAPGADIHVNLENDQLHFTSHRWKRRIPATDASRMRDIPPVSGASFTMAAGVIQRLLHQTAHAADTDENFPNRQCVVLRGEGQKIRAMASDGHRAAMAQVNLSEPFNDTVVIHQRALRELRQLLKQHEKHSIEVVPSKDRLFFRVAETTVAILPVVVQPIDLTRCFGQQMASRYVVGSRLLSKILRTSAELSGADKVTLCFDAEGLTVESESATQGAARDTLEGEFSGPDTKVTLCTRLLREAVQALGGETISLEVGGDRSAVVVRPTGAEEADAEVVIMPIN